ncbi:ribonuclease H-like domain-containing protein [Tanacetum coccineum]
MVIVALFPLNILLCKSYSLPLRLYSSLVKWVQIELKSAYEKVDGYAIFNLLQEINNVKQGGIDDCYQPVKSALLTRDPLLKVKDAYTTVSREESHKGILESSSAIELKMSAIYFAAKSVNNSRRFFNNNNNGTRGSNNNNINRGPNPNLVCKNYGMIGHTIERCYEIIGYPSGFKKVYNTIKQNCFNKQNFNANFDVKNNDRQAFASVSSTDFTSEQMQKLLSLINDNSTRSVHANMADRASLFNGDVKINFYRYYCANSNLYVKTITLVWIIDSGANQHLIVSTVGMFYVIDITSLKIFVGHPNDTLATISHVGDLKLSNNVVLYDVLVVPGYYVSLLYVNKLIRDSKMYVGFDEDKCYIKYLKKEKVLGTGSEYGGLYLFDMDKVNNVGKSNMIMCFNVSKLLWHNRLGHPSDKFLSVLESDLNITKNCSVHVCEVCYRAK